MNDFGFTLLARYGAARRGRAAMPRKEGFSMVCRLT